MPAAICLCYFMPYYINDDESHFVPRNPQRGRVRAVRFVLCESWFDIELIKARTTVFSIYNLMLGEKTKWNPSQPSGPLMIGFWKMKLDLTINARELSTSPSQCPLPQMANMMIWWIILFKVLDDVHIFFFCLCLSVFQSQNPNIIMWYQCWIKNCLIQPLSLNVAEPEVHVCVIWS